MNEPWLIVIVLGLLIFVYAWIRYRADVQKERPRISAAEMEETLEMFAREIEEDNDRIIKHVSSLNRKWGDELRKLEQRVAQLEERQSAQTAAAPAASPAPMSVAPAAAKPADAVNSASRTPAAEDSSAAQPAAPVAAAEHAGKPGGTAPAAAEPGVGEADAAPSAAPDRAPHPDVRPGAPAAEPTASPGSISERYRSVLDLHRSGKSVEYIAKKTGMNKGEVQLVLTLAKREEALREG